MQRTPPDALRLLRFFNASFPLFQAPPGLLGPVDFFGVPGVMLLFLALVIFSSSPTPSPQGQSVSPQTFTKDSRFPLINYHCLSPLFNALSFRRFSRGVRGVRATMRPPHEITVCPPRRFLLRFPCFNPPFLPGLHQREEKALNFLPPMIHFSLVSSDHPHGNLSFSN